METNAIYVNNETLIAYMVYGVGVEPKDTKVYVIHQEFSEEQKPIFLVEMKEFLSNFTLACELNQADKVGNRFLHTKIKQITKRLEREHNEEDI